MKKKNRMLISALSLMLCVTGCGEKNTNESSAEPTKVVASSGDVTQAVTTEEPATAEPTTQEPTTQEPTTQEPTTEEPTTQEPTTEKPVEYLFTKDTYPRVDGATAQYPMSIEIAMATMGLTKTEAEDFIKHNKTNQAYYNLIHGDADVIFVSEPSDDIIQQAKEAGVTFEMTGIGRDAFVFVTNEENPVDSLTLDQIRDIYSGKITNWKDVGGADKNIIPYQRPKNSGSQNLMEKMVMKDRPLMEAPSHMVPVGMDAVLELLTYENGPEALGYSVYLYAKELYVVENIKFMKIDGIAPNDRTIKSGEYPLSKVVYAVYRNDEPQDSPVRKLCEWLLTDEGQEAVVAGGYTSIR